MYCDRSGDIYLICEVPFMMKLLFVHLVIYDLESCKLNVDASSAALWEFRRWPFPQARAQRPGSLQGLPGWRPGRVPRRERGAGRGRGRHELFAQVQDIAEETIRGATEGASRKGSRLRQVCTGEGGETLCRRLHLHIQSCEGERRPGAAIRQVTASWAQLKREQ